MNGSFAQTYPRLTEWITTHGWIELGQTDWTRSFIRVLDEGGMVWEGDERYPSLEDALLAAEHAVITWWR
jgi:hypothetical protein